jgi:hypothetical protein
VGNLAIISGAISAWCAQNKPMSETAFSSVYFNTFGNASTTTGETVPFTGNDIGQVVSDRKVWVCPKFMQRNGYTVLSDVPATTLSYCRDGVYGAYRFFSYPPGITGYVGADNYYCIANNVTLGLQITVCLDSGLYMRYHTSSTTWVEFCPDDIGVKYRYSLGW